MTVYSEHASVKGVLQSAHYCPRITVIWKDLASSKQWKKISPGRTMRDFQQVLQTNLTTTTMRWALIPGTKVSTWVHLYYTKTHTTYMSCAWLMNPEAGVVWKLFISCCFWTQNHVKLGPGKREPHPPIKCQPRWCDQAVHGRPELYNQEPPGPATTCWTCTGWARFQFTKPFQKQRDDISFGNGT